LGGFSDSEESALPTTPFTHSALRELYVHNIGYIDPSETLDLAIFPSLEKFGYTSSDGTPFPRSAFPSLFDRSNCQLTHFELSGDLRNVKSNHFISILFNLPTVTHLKLEDSYGELYGDTIMSDELLQWLTPTLRRDKAVWTKLLPRLVSLDFLGHETFSWSSLANLVDTTTLNGHSTLGRTKNSIRRIFFRVYHWPGTESIDLDSVVRFKCACDAGISINIVYEQPLSLASGSIPAVSVYPLDIFP